MVKTIYIYKNTTNATLVRILGTSSVAIVAVTGLYLLRHIFWDGTDLPLPVSLAFTISSILGLIVFFWFNRKTINKHYYK